MAYIKTIYKVRGQQGGYFEVKDVEGSAQTFLNGTANDPRSGATIALSAGAATDEMDITITVTNSAGTTVADAHNIEVWISDSETTKTITGTAASGALTAVDGGILSVLTAKKHVICVTPVTGVINLSLVDSANTAGEVVYVKLPNGTTVQSAASVATDYEGGT